LRAALAVAVAAGKSVADWASENQIARRTAYQWYRRADFRRAVLCHRSRLMDRAVGQLQGKAVAAATELGRLVTEGQPTDGVRLAAARAVLTEAWRFSDIERRLTELERSNRARDAEQAEPTGGAAPDPAREP